MLDTGTRARQIRALSGVAGHLASALDVLLLSGCDCLTADILEMLAVIDGQIAWLAVEAHGCDMSLLESNLRKAPAERLRADGRALTAARALREAMERHATGP